MTRKNLAYFDGQYGHLMIVDDFMDSEIVTTAAHADRYIRIDDGRQYPQLCAGGNRMGNTLIWAREWDDIPAQFARDCDARLYKTRKGYDKACAARRASIARYGYPDADKAVYFG
jgi:hypothetical protein